jgi:hypothetical protein
MEAKSMICLACIFFILALMPAAYYFLGPVSIIFGSLGILYLAYRKLGN